jgi:hypothetical protein
MVDDPMFSVYYEDGGDDEDDEQFDEDELELLAEESITDWDNE